MAKQINKALLRSILHKRQSSEPLNNEEESYAREIFNDMMDSKKSINKVVRILTGEQLRKQDKTGAEATRKDPRYPEGKNPAKVEGENTDPDVVTPPSKLVDADNKPKANYSEQERLQDITQEITPPRTEAVKFVSLDPAKVGDVVVKNVAKEGQMILQGVVLKVDEVNQTAMVKWADKRTSVEFLHGLVKAKKSEAAAAAEDVQVKDPKLGVSESEEDAKNAPMTKFTKDGDIAEAKNYGMNTPAGSPPKTTPFEDLVSTLQHLIGLASELKEKQERTDDQEIKDYYDQLLGQLRGIAETILAGLDMELKEAQSEYDEADNE